MNAKIFVISMLGATLTSQCLSAAELVDAMSTTVATPAQGNHVYDTQTKRVVGYADVQEMERMGLIPKRPSDSQLKPVQIQQMSSQLLGLHDASMQNWKASRDASKKLLEITEKITQALSDSTRSTAAQASSIQGGLNANGAQYRALEAEEKSLRAQLAGADKYARAAIEAMLNQVIGEKDSLYAATQRMLGDSGSKIRSKVNERMGQVTD